ncbi:MAG: ATP-binding cassette domain-containing protein, partial [Microbacterium sp.]
VVASAIRGGVVEAQSRTADLLGLATGGAERAARYRAGFLGPTIGALSAPAVSIVVCAAAVDPLVALVLAATLAVAPIVILVAQRAVRPAGAAHRRERARLTAAFLTAVQGLGTLVLARAAEREARGFAARGERHRRSVMRVLAVNQLLILVMDATVSLAVVLVAAVVAVSRTGDGLMTAGDGISAVLLALVAIRPVDLVGQFFSVAIGGRAAERALGAQLGRRTPVREDATADEPEGAASIALERVTAGWGRGAPVLRGVSLRVEPGEHVALVGRSGVGKSTVSALLQAHLLPEEGRVGVGGPVTEGAPGAQIRRRLAVVEQRTFLFHGTVGDNLRIAAPGADEAELWEALDQAGLAAEIARMPRGLDTPVGEHGALLSGGQAQRLAIARAFLRDAPILVLDEPTSQIDLASEAVVLAALARLARGRTVLMIAHRPGAILAADRTIELTEAGVRA